MCYSCKGIDFDCTIFRLVLDLTVPAMWYALLFIIIIAICTYNYMHVKRHHTIAYL